MTDENFNKSAEKLGAFINNLNLLCDTSQREALICCLKKATKDIKEGRQIKLNTVLL